MSADAAYEAIRQSTTDVTAMARHTGLKPANIQRVKQHLFYDVHLLDRYVEIGVPAEWRRFDSDRAIAQAWHRLTQGQGTAADRQLLRHETAEAYLMRRWQDPSYHRAHTRAQRRFPAPDLET